MADELPPQQAAAAATQQVNYLGYPILAAGQTPTPGISYAMGMYSGQLMRYNAAGSVEIFSAGGVYNPSAPAPIAPGPTGQYITYQGTGATVSAIYTAGAQAYTPNPNITSGGFLYNPQTHALVSGGGNIVAASQGIGGTTPWSGSMGGAPSTPSGSPTYNPSAPAPAYVQGQQINPSVGFLPGQSPEQQQAQAQAARASAVKATGYGGGADYTVPDYLKTPTDAGAGVKSPYKSDAAFTPGNYLQSPFNPGYAAMVSTGYMALVEPLRSWGESETKSVNDWATGARAGINLKTGGITESGVDTNAPIKGYMNALIAGGEAIGAFPGFVAQVPSALGWVVSHERGEVGTKGFEIGSGVVSQTLKTEASNPGSIVGTIGGNLLLGKTFNVAAAKVVGYGRTVGMEYVPIEDIGYDVTAGYPKTKAAQSVANLKESFATGTLKPEPEFMQSAAGYQVEGPVPYLHGEGGIPTARLPGVPSDASIAYTAHPADYWAGKTPVGGRTTLLEGGSSEQPGTYAAPVAETYFSKVATQADTSLFGMGIPGVTQRPAIYATTLEPSQIVGASRAARAAAPADMAAVKAATDSSKYGWTSLTEDMLKKAGASDEGILYLPRMKGEFEGIFPVGSVTEITGRQFYTNIGGQRVPIVQQKLVGFEPQEVVATAAEATGPSSASGSYYYGAARAGEINPLSGGIAAAGATETMYSGINAKSAVSSKAPMPAVSGYYSSDYAAPSTESANVPSKYKSTVTFSGYTPEFYSATPAEIEAARVEESALSSSAKTSGVALMSQSAIVDGASEAYSASVSPSSSVSAPSSASSLPSVVPYSASFALAGPPSLASGSYTSSSSAFGSYGGSYGGSSSGSSSGGSSIGGSSGRSSRGGSSSGSSSGGSSGGSSKGGSSGGSSYGGSYKPDKYKPELTFPPIESPFDEKRKKKLPKRKGFGFNEVFSFDVRTTHPNGLAFKSPVPEAKAKARTYIKQKVANNIPLFPGEAEFAAKKRTTRRRGKK